MKIYRVENIQGTPVMSLAVDAWKELDARGLTAGEIPYDWQHCAFWAEQEGQPVGTLIYKEQHWNHSIYIAMGYVRPDWRGKGVYRALWEQAVGFAKGKKLRLITGTTHWENSEMRAIMERMGRKPVAITYDYPLTVEEEECGSP